MAIGDCLPTNRSILTNKIASKMPVLSTSYTLQFQRYCLDNILSVKVTTVRSNVKSRSHHAVAHLQPQANVSTKYQLPTPYAFRDIAPPTNVPTKYQLSTPYGFQDIARTRFCRSRSLRQGQRSNKVTPMMMHTYTP